MIANDKAYLQFNDVSEIDTLEFTFDELKVPDLGDASITVITGEFQWP